MPHYMFQAKYSVPAFGAMIAKPQDRTKAAKDIVNAAGGKLVGLWFAMGEYDIVAIIDAPDDEAMAAAVMVLAASGAFSGGKTTKLFTPAEAKAAMVRAGEIAPSYRPVTG